MIDSNALQRPPLPQFDADDIHESAVVSRLAGNWSHRATVKKSEPDLDDVFDLAKQDFPDELIPFSGHRTFRELDEGAQNRLRSWGWIAFNKNVMDIEQHVVNPGFALLSQDAFDTAMGDTLSLAVTQAMVDEQYHTLMHLNASVLTRRHRGWAMPDRALPHSLTVRRQRDAVAQSESAWHGALTTLAYATVAEISITSYLDLIEDNDVIQPVNRATVKLHNRDEYCHASIADEMACIVFGALDKRDRRHFLGGLADAMDAFSSSDSMTWAAISRSEGIDGADDMLADTEADTSRPKLVQDYSGIRSLCVKLDVVDDINIAWT